MSTLADRVREARADRGATQTALAKAAGVTRAAVAQWENGGTRTISSEHLHAAAGYLGCNARWLATGRGAKTTVVDEKAAYRNHTPEQQRAIDALLSLSPEELAVAQELISLTKRSGLTKKPPRKKKTQRS